MSARAFDRHWKLLEPDMLKEVRHAYRLIYPLFQRLFLTKRRVADTYVILPKAPALSISASAGAQPSSVPEVSTLSEKQEITSLVLKQPTTSWSAPQLKDVLASMFVLRLEAVSKQQKISEWLLL